METPQKNFTIVSNEILDNGHKLGLTIGDVFFLIKVEEIQRRNGGRVDVAIHDSEIDAGLSTRALQRRRKKLRDGGFINTKLSKQKLNGHFVTRGVVYDLSPTFKKLKELHKQENKPAVKKVLTEEQKARKEASKNSSRNFGLKKFFEKYEKRMGHRYFMTEKDKALYARLPLYKRDALAYAVEFGLEQGLEPNLVLYLGTPFRMKQLVLYCYNLGYIDLTDAELEECRIRVPNPKCEVEKTEEEIIKEREELNELKEKRFEELKERIHRIYKFDEKKIITKEQYEEFLKTLRVNMEPVVKDLSETYEINYVYPVVGSKMFEASSGEKLIPNVTRISRMGLELIQERIFNKINKRMGSLTEEDINDLINDSKNASYKNLSNDTITYTNFEFAYTNCLV